MATTVNNQDRPADECQEHWKRIATRIEAKKPTVVVGHVSPGAVIGLRLVRVRCAGGTLGPLRLAEERVREELGEVFHLFGGWNLTGALRQRILGEASKPPPELSFLEAANRLASRTGDLRVLWIEGLEQCEDSALLSLRRIARMGHALRLPLVLVFRSEPAGEGGKSLVDAFREIHGDAAIVHWASGQPDGASAAGSTFSTASVRELPTAARATLRAACTVGATFDIEIVSRLLAVDPGAALVALQEAADAGAPIEDHGDGSFALPPSLASAVRSDILPSLRLYWHEQLGEMMSSERGPSSADDEDAGFVVRASTETRRAAHVARRIGEISASPDPTRVDDPSHAGGPIGAEDERPATRVWEELFEDAYARTPVQISVAPERRVFDGGSLSALSENTRTAPSLRRSEPSKRVDDARAADHFEAAGQRGEAIAHRLKVVKNLALQGDGRRAWLVLEEIAAQVAGVAAGGAKELLDARIQLERGRIEWLAMTASDDFSLTGAKKATELAYDAMPKSAPVEVKLDLAETLAGICFDLGDLESLERALALLATSSRELLEQGHALEAARLLNDHAAILLRAGDPVQASHLLSESKKLFEARLGERPGDAATMREIAETDHLTARIPFHARLRPGREDDAYALALEHARGAEQLYQRLGSEREIGRVWETMGRLEMKRGRMQLAQARFEAALGVEERLGDLTGLARVTAAMAELLVVSGRPEAALLVLAESIDLNRRAGSPLGLALNEQAFAELRRVMDAMPLGREDGWLANPKVREVLRRVETGLGEAAAEFAGARVSVELPLRPTRPADSHIDERTPPPCT